MITINATVNAGLTANFATAVSKFEKKAEQAVSAVTDDIVEELVKRCQEQIALPENAIRSDIEIKKNGIQAEIIARHRPVQLEEYAHRATHDGVDVIINPGQVSHISGAFISRNGSIVIRSQGQLFGPETSQVARTEFPDLADKARRDLINRLS